MKARRDHRGVLNICKVGKNEGENTWEGNPNRVDQMKAGETTSERSFFVRWAKNEGENSWEGDPNRFGRMKARRDPQGVLNICEWEKNEGENVWEGNPNRVGRMKSWRGTRAQHLQKRERVRGEGHLGGRSESSGLIMSSSRTAS
jgi:hypothetical protein